MKKKNKIFLFLGVFLAVCLIVGGVIWYILAQKQNDDVEAQTPDDTGSVSLFVLHYDKDKGFVDADGNAVDIFAFHKNGDGSYSDDIHLLTAEKIDEFLHSVGEPYSELDIKYLVFFGYPDPTLGGLPEDELIALSYDDGWKGFVDADGKPVDILSFVKQADGSYTDGTYTIPADEVEKFVRSVKEPYTDKEKAYLALFASPMPEPSSEDDPDTTESSESESLVEDNTEATESDTEDSTEKSSSTKSSTEKNKPETGTTATTEVKPHTTESTERPASTTSSSKEPSTEAPQPKPIDTEKPKEDTTEAKGCNHIWDTRQVVIKTIHHEATYKQEDIGIDVWEPDEVEKIACNRCGQIFDDARSLRDDAEHEASCGCHAWGTRTVTVGGHYRHDAQWVTVVDTEAWDEPIYGKETYCTLCGEIK